MKVVVPLNFGLNEKGFIHHKSHSQRLFSLAVSGFSNPLAVYLT
jgi:hypothetical protein